MGGWTRESALETLQNNGFQVVHDSRLANDLGFQLKCADGEIVCVFDTGKLSIQGRNQPALKALFGQVPPAAASGAAGAIPSGVQGNRNIFVVYGHDTRARTDLEAMLRRWGLKTSQEREG